MNRLHLLAWATLATCAVPHWAVAADATPLKTSTVQSENAASASQSLDGVVEAVRQTVLASQVAGALVSLSVKAGDSVRAGQELLRIDARAAQQQVSASASQVEAAQANLKVASQELERQKQLHQKQYISQAALERTQAQWEAAQAQVNALQAQTKAAQTQSGFFVLNAPYAGVISEVPVTVGDMAMPGRPLLTLYDPSSLRITAALPQALLPQVTPQLAAVRYELPGTGAAGAQHSASKVELLPTVDPVTHTAPIRLQLPTGSKGITPGMFARVWLPSSTPAQASNGNRLYVPSNAIVRRAEMTGVYVVDAQGKAHLRQIRTGRSTAERTEVLSGLRANEQVAADPQAAAATR